LSLYNGVFFLYVLIFLIEPILSLNIYYNFEQDF